MTPASAWATKCATIGCRNERRLAGTLCVPCAEALKAKPPAEQFAAKARLPELFDEPEPVAPPPLGTTRRPRARKTDRATSHEATTRAARGLTTKQRAVLSVFQQYGRLHDEQLVECYRELRRTQLARGFGEQIPDMTDSSIRTRRAELVTLGRVRDTGHKTTTARGGPTTVWERVGQWEPEPSAATPPTTAHE
jgi:hypothetical protein